MQRSLFLAFAFLMLSITAVAQIQTGDVLLATTTGYTLLRPNGGTSTATPVVPVSQGANPFTITSFSNGAVMHLPGTQYVLAAHGLAGTYSIWLLDFTSSITAPLAFQLGGGPVPTQTAGITSLALDRLTGDVYFLQGTNVGRIAGPISSTSSVPSTYFATGQTSAQALTVVANSTVIVASSTGCWPVASGATATAPNQITFTGSGCSDLKFDALGNRLIVAAFGLNRIDIYNLATNTFINSPIVAPALSLADSCDIDENNAQVYAVSRLTSNIGGAPYGVQTSNDNVVVRNSTGGPSSTVSGFSPSTGHGNGGNNPFITLVKPQSAVVSALQFNPGSTTNFASGTMTAAPTVATIAGLPTITSSAQDALIGGTVTFSASYTGTDTAFLSNLALTNVTMDLFVPPATVGQTPTATFTFTNGANGGVVAGFTGPANGIPTAARRFSLTGGSATVNNAAASASVVTLAARVSGGSPISIDFTSTGVPSLKSIDVSAAVGLSAFEGRVRTTGFGDCYIGVINATPFAEQFLLATTILSTPLGSGPFLGLASDPLLFQEASYPIGTQPFHFYYDANGQYSFIVPSGIPAGISIDSVVLQYIPNLLVQYLPPIRTNF